MRARLDRLLNILNLFEEYLLGLTLLALALFVFVQVVLRYGFHFAFSWAEELGRYATIFLTFLGASLGVKHGTHFSVEALVAHLPARAASLVRCLAHVVSGLFFLLVIVFAWAQIRKLARYGASTATLRIPMYVPYIPIPLFSISIAARFFKAAYDQFQAFRRGGAPT